MLTLFSPQLLPSTITTRFISGGIGPCSFVTHPLCELFTFFSSIIDSPYPMTPRPADFEVLQRPVWDPAPGTACLWKCIKEKPLAMHRLSDRVLGSLYIAITGELIEKSDCNLNESDLAEDFSIRSLRCRYNLGHGLLTPDGKAVVSIPAPKKRGGDLVLRGSGNATAYLPVVRYDHKIFQDKYPNWEQWRDELMFRRRSDGTLEERALLSYSGNSKDSTPPDWPQGLTRDRELASEDYYRKKNRR